MNEQKLDNQDAIPVLPLPDPIFDFKNNISIFAFSQQGQSHLLKEKPCQDRCSFRVIGDSLMIAAIADGVGSCLLSDYGSLEAVQSSLDYLEQQLGPLSKQSDFVMEEKLMGKILRETMQYAYDCVEKKAEQLEQLLYSFQSTLTIAVYDGNTLYFAHAGDDGIVALDKSGRYAMVTSRHKGEEANSVFPLQNKSTWQFGKVNDTVAFVMVTDGVLDAFVRPESEDNRVYYPFIQPIFSAVMNSLEDTKSNCEDWFAYMSSPGYRDKVIDDLTLVAVVHQSEDKQDALPDFDIEKWNQETEEYTQKRMAALYPSLEKSTEPAISEDTAASEPNQSEHIPKLEFTLEESLIEPLEMIMDAGTSHLRRARTVFTSFTINAENAIVSVKKSIRQVPKSKLPKKSSAQKKAAAPKNPETTKKETKTDE